MISGQALGDLFEILSTVSGHVEARTRTILLARIVPIESISLSLVSGNKECVRICGMHLQVNDPRFFINVEDLFPSLSAIGRLVEATFFVGAPESS